MLGFILSKMNLLILVVALFAIIAYFMFSLGEVVKQNEAQLMAQEFSKDVSTMLTSATYCDRITLTLRPYFAVLGQDRFYYILKISSADDDNDPETGNFLIFSIKPATEDYLVGAQSVRTFANIHLYNTVGFLSAEEADPEEGIELNPQAEVPQNAFTVIKKVIKGEQHIYIIPCNIGYGTSAQDICKSEILNVYNLTNLQQEGISLEDFKC